MYVTDEDVQDALAQHLKLSGGRSALTASAVGVVHRANERAYQDVRGALLARGYTAAQIDAWDRAAEYQQDIALFWALVDGANDGASDTWVDKLDRRKELMTVTVTLAGVVVLPGATTTLGEASFGRLNAACDTTGFNRTTRW